MGTVVTVTMVTIPAVTMVTIPAVTRVTIHAVSMVTIPAVTMVTIPAVTMVTIHAVTMVTLRRYKDLTYEQVMRDGGPPDWNMLQCEKFVDHCHADHVLGNNTYDRVRWGRG